MSEMPRSPPFWSLRTSTEERAHGEGGTDYPQERPRLLVQYSAPLSVASRQPFGAGTPPHWPASVAHVTSAFSEPGSVFPGAVGSPAFDHPPAPGATQCIAVDDNTNV